MRTKTRPESLHVQERRAFAVRMRQAGHTYRAIYAAARRQFGATLPPTYSPRRVHADVLHALQTQQAELADHVEQVRVMELARLDALQVALWGRAASGDIQAILGVLRIMARRARYLPGLEGPVQVAQTMPGGQVSTHQTPPVLLTEDERRAIVYDLVQYGRERLARDHNGAGPVEPHEGEPPWSPP